MIANHNNRVDELRHWIKSLDQRPGVYLIENVTNGACYVGSATKSIRQRLGNTLTMLNGGRHHAYLLQADWLHYGVQNFVWWACYAAAATEALEEERRLVIIANAFEDYGGYCQRTGRNCVAASFRETERKLAKARARRYVFLPRVNPADRINPLLLSTFQPSTTTVMSRGHLLSQSPEQLRQFEEWRLEALSPCKIRKLHGHKDALK